MSKVEIFLADIPVFYNSRKTGGKFGSGAEGTYKEASQFRQDHRKAKGWTEDLNYSLLKNDELLEVADEVKKCSADNAILLSWATLPTLPFALEWIARCGFKYKTSIFTWLKLNKDGNAFVYSPGFYTGSNVELCLLATKGRLGAPDKKMSPSVIMFEDAWTSDLKETVILSPRAKHSQKPILQPHIDLMYPEVKNKVELFAREEHGKESKYPWKSLGIEIDGLDILESLEILKNE